LLSDRFTPHSREQLVQKASHGLIEAARWLIDQGVRCARLLPYTLQIVMLAQFFSERRPTDTEAKVLRRWLFASSFSGWYAGGNTTQVNDDLAEMDRFKRREAHSFVVLRERANPFPERFDLRSARVRAFLLATLVHKNPLHRPGQHVDVVSLLPSNDVASVPRVFPRIAPPLVSAPANRILLPTVDGRGARRQLLDLPDHERGEVLASHCIDDAAWAALQADDAADFVRTRTSYLIAVERELMRELDIEPPDRETEDVLLDADG
jgi:hypothetical protein